MQGAVETMTDYEAIRYDVADAVATLTLNRPDHINGMTTRKPGETDEALTAAAADPSLRVLVLTGAGDRAFCRGRTCSGQQRTILSLARRNRATFVCPCCCTNCRQ